MARLLFYILFFVWQLPLHGQHVFNMAYDNNLSYESGRGIAQTQDGGYVSYGKTGYVSSPLDSVIMVKLNSEGIIQWKFTLDIQPGLGDNFTRSIIEIADGSIIACGFAPNAAATHMHPYLIKVTAQGQLVWVRRYGNASLDQFVEQVQQTADGGFALAGNYNGIGWLIKTDSLGFLEWDEQYVPIPGINIYSLDISHDGGFILGGTSSASGLAKQFLLIKTDSLGNQEWFRHFGGTGNDYGEVVITAFDGGYMIGGNYNETDGYAIKTDSAGNEQWHYQSYFGDYNSLRTPVQLPDSSFVLMGSARFTATRWDGRLTKISPQGNFIWERAYRYHTGATDDYFYDITHCTDGGFAMAGMIINNALPQKNDMWILKVDACGNTVGDTLNPVASMSLSNGVGVNSNTYTFTNQSSGHCGQLWHFGDGDSTFTTNPQHIYQPGTYTVMLVAFAGTYSDTVYQQITVYPCGEVPGDTLLPVAAMQILPDSTSGTFYLSSQSTEYCSLFWDFGDGTTSTNSNPQHTYTQTGTYSITHIAVKGQNADTVTQQVQVLLGLEEKVEAVSVQLYPNPNSGEFTIVFEPQPEQGQLQIYDLNGKLVYFETISAGSNSLQLAQPNLAKGLYHSRLIWKGKTGTARFVKH